MSSKTFNHQIFCWLHQLNRDKRVLAIDVRVAVELARYFDEKDQGGRAWPTCKTIADAVGVHETSVLRAMRRLEVTGHVRVIWGRQGRGHSSQYWMIVKPAEAQVLKPARRQQKKPAAMQETLKEPPTEAPKGASSVGLEREDRCRDQDSTNFGGAPLKGAPKCFEERPEQPVLPFEAAAPPQAEPPQETGGERAGQEEPSESPSAGEERIHAAWRALRDVWAVRPWPATPRELAIARQCFVKEVAGGASVEVIIGGASAWVCGCDAPRYLPQLANWLIARGWEKPPPAKKNRRAAAGPSGGALAISGGYLPRTNGKVDVGRLAFRNAGPDAALPYYLVGARS